MDPLASREISLGSEVCLFDPSPHWLRYHLSEAICLLYHARRRAHSIAEISVRRLAIIIQIQIQSDSTVSTFSSVHALRLPLPELHQQPVDAVLRPTFVHKLCCKLPSVVTFTFYDSCRRLIKVLSSLLSGIKVAAFA